VAECPDLAEQFEPLAKVTPRSLDEAILLCRWRGP
jgi:hypothetical protein